MALKKRIETELSSGNNASDNVPPRLSSVLKRSSSSSPFRTYQLDNEDIAAWDVCSEYSPSNSDQVISNDQVIGRNLS